MEWTITGKEELERYLGKMRMSLEASGADANEVADDIRRHVEEELAGENLEIVSQQDVARILAKMGPAEHGEQKKEEGTPERSETKKGLDEKLLAPSGLAVATVVLFGILLPAVTLIVEVLSGLCASIFFDPIPTVWHCLLVASVPIANALALAVLVTGRFEHPKKLSWLLGIAFGASLYYTIVFLPVAPFGLFGIIYFGLGLIPLSPIISVVVLGRMKRKLGKLAIERGMARLPGMIRPTLLVFLFIFLLDLPYTAALVGTQMAGSEQQSRRTLGLKVLRCCAREEVLLESCYRGRRAIMDVFGFVYGMSTTPVPIEERRNIYYRVTGTPYNAVRPPEMRGLRRGSLIDPDEWDFAQGGDRVAARVRDLSLDQSRMDGIVNPEEGTAYVEWTFVFKNDSAVQREARAEIALPPGAVVSKLTLWIDGEEREAAYSGRSRVKSAYKRVVQRRRDPVLVTTSGPDNVLLQCFPVPPMGGTMKTRIGITVPLVLESYDAGLMRLPYFVEQNFSLREDLAHSVWIEGSKGLACMVPTVEMIQEQPKPNLYALRGKVTDAELSAPFAVRVDREGSSNVAWAKDYHDQNFVVQQRIEEKAVGATKRVVFVVDGSMRMKQYIDVIADTVLNLPDGPEFAVVLAADEVEELVKLQKSTGGSRADAAAKISRIKCAGGCDNVPALIEAWEIAAATQNSAIVWLHATQPIQMHDSEELIQKWERRGGNPKLYDFQFGSGANMVAKSLESVRAVNRVSNFGNSRNALTRMANEWSGEAKRLVYRRERVKAGGQQKGIEATAHVVRLKMYAEVLELAASQSDADKIQGIKIAQAYQLVTPVSGAVVLESEDQYKEAGLSPVDGKDTPGVVPEPETWALMIVGIVVLFVCGNRKAKLCMVTSDDS
jgi:hypothetical protein